MATIFFRGRTEVPYPDYSYMCLFCFTEDEDRHVCTYCRTGIDAQECEEYQGKCAICAETVNLIKSM